MESGQPVRCLQKINLVVPTMNMPMPLNLVTILTEPTSAPTSKIYQFPAHINTKTYPFSMYK